jgi:hypothetical protein
MRRTVSSLLVVIAFFVVMVTAASSVGAIASSHHARIHVEPLVNFALPSKAAGCGGTTALAGGAERIPITVSTVAGQVGETVNVCIGGKGPFPFIIDTGAAVSFIDTRLADRLDLAEGSPIKYSGFGCTGTGQIVAVPSWSVSGVALAPQTLGAAEQPGVGAAGQPDGLLGSDVLSRFGSMRLDFKAQTLTFEGPQGAAIMPPVGGEVQGPTGPLPPTALTHGQRGTTVPLTVVLTPGNISLNVPVRFGNAPAQDFVVDTGSSQSLVANVVVPSAHLAHSDLAQRQDTACSIITVPLVHSGHWSLPGLTLHPQLLAAANLGPVGPGGIAGAVGSDQLKRFGWVIFDYSGGRLVLG